MSEPQQVCTYEGADGKPKHCKTEISVPWCLLLRRQQCNNSYYAAQKGNFEITPLIFLPVLSQYLSLLFLQVFLRKISQEVSLPSILFSGRNTSAFSLSSKGCYCSALIILRGDGKGGNEFKHFLRPAVWGRRWRKVEKEFMLCCFTWDLWPCGVTPIENKAVMSSKGKHMTGFFRICMDF